MDMGRRVERGLKQIDLIRIGLSRVCVESRSALEALLEVSDSIMTYRSRYRTVFQLAPVLDLLLVDESNPKSLAYQFSRLVDHVEHLPRQSDLRFDSREEQISLEILTAVRLVDLKELRCEQDDPKIAALVEFLGTMEQRLKDFTQAISAHYLTRVPVTPHFSTLTGSGVS